MNIPAKLRKSEYTSLVYLRLCAYSLLAGNSHFGGLHFVQREAKHGLYPCLLGNLGTRKHGLDFVIVLIG